MLRAIIIDDESNGIETLKLLTLKYIPNLKIVDSSTNPEKGIEMIENYRPDIVFLDINMPIINGFQVLENLNFKDFKLLFTTAHSEHAIKAFKHKAFDYLLKPIDVDDLKLTINRIIEDGGKHVSNEIKKFRTIELAVKDGFLFIKPDEIIRIEASGSYTEFYLANNIKHIASKSMKDFENQLDPNYFYRCHLSHIVNLRKIKKLTNKDGLFAVMDNESTVPVAKKNKKDFLVKLKNSE